MALGEPGSLRFRGLGNPAGCLDLAVVNSPLWRSAQVPAVNLHATAVGLTRLYAGLLAGGVLDGVRLLREDTVADLLRVHYDGPDLLLERPVRWTLGMQQEGTAAGGWAGSAEAWRTPTRRGATRSPTRPAISPATTGSSCSTRRCAPAWAVSSAYPCNQAIRAPHSRPALRLVKRPTRPGAGPSRPQPTTRVRPRAYPLWSPAPKRRRPPAGDGARRRGG